MKQWLLNHLRALLFSLRALVRPPFANCLTIVAIGIALSFPLTLLALLLNAEKLANTWQNHPTISLYLKSTLSEEQLYTLMQQLNKRSDLMQVKYISPTEGLDEFKQQTGLGASLDVLPQNPLPGVVEVTPNFSLDSEEKLENLLNSLSQFPDVQTSPLDSAWIKRLSEWFSFGKRMTYGLLALFSLGVVLIIGNTMRLITQTHRHEILILKLIGGSQAFIRRPLLYRGALYGVAGGITAWLLVTLFFYWLKNPVQQLADSYHSVWRLHSLPWTANLLLIASCAALGLIGAWASVQYYLQAPEEID